MFVDLFGYSDANFAGFMPHTKITQEIIFVLSLRGKMWYTES